MEPTFWIDRWREGRIAFHEGAPNTFLVKHHTQLAGPRVLVPLCGKTEDLAFLAGQGHEVIGVELVEDAVRAFFAEHAATPDIATRGAATAYTAGTITILAGDFFAIRPSEVGAIDAIYDRAALIALPAPTRRRYVEHLRTLAPAGTRVLLVTLEYPQDAAEGPPFSVPEDEVRALYASAALVDDRAATGGRLVERGIPVRERCYVATL